VDEDPPLFGFEEVGVSDEVDVGGLVGWALSVVELQEEVDGVGEGEGFLAVAEVDELLELFEVWVLRQGYFWRVGRECGGSPNKNVRASSY
jgi:hypothetical protein